MIGWLFKSPFIVDLWQRVAPPEGSVGSSPQVMLAQAEEELEEDSAFGSNRSTPGTPGSGDSPTQSSQRLLGKARQWAEPDQEVEEEEGVASWASVRMQGDRKRQEDERESGLLTRRSDTHTHTHAHTNTYTHIHTHTHIYMVADAPTLKLGSKYFQSLKCVCPPGRRCGTAPSS